MTPPTFSSPCPIAILASGNGSNFQALVDATRDGRIAATVCHMITNRPNAFVIQRAQQCGIATTIVPDLPDRNAYAHQLMTVLHRCGAELVCLAGFMRVLAPPVVEAFRGRMLNIHPSLLPRFPGLHAVRHALQARARETGVTVHFVDEGLDTGSIIAQATIPITPGDTEATLATRIHTVEHQLYPTAVQRVIEGNVPTP